MAKREAWGGGTDSAVMPNFYAQAVWRRPSRQIGSHGQYQHDLSLLARSGRLSHTTSSLVCGAGSKKPSPATCFWTLVQGSRY